MHPAPGAGCECNLWYLGKEVRLPRVFRSASQSVGRWRSHDTRGTAFILNGQPRVHDESTAVPAARFRILPNATGV